MVEKFRLFDTSQFPLYSLIHSIVVNPTRVAQKFGDFVNQAHLIDGK